MAEVIAIEGGYKLNGTVRISGAKNATVALIPAAVLSDGPVEILGVPEISDVEALAILLEELKCKVEVDGERIRIDPTHMEDKMCIRDRVRISDYETTVGKSRPGNFENKHQQAGDPDKAGEVIVDVVNGDDLPEILTLGAAAVDAVIDTLQGKINELEKWREVSNKCDFE